MEQNQIITLANNDNIRQIMAIAPVAIDENKISRDRCLSFGQTLLAKVKAGMNDDLDQEASLYIEKARKTVKKMNEKRTPVTKLFDMVRSSFTQLENEVDVTKPGTIPYQIQQFRNQYAAKKREEEERERRQKELLAKTEAAKERFISDIVADLQKSYNYTLRHGIDSLDMIFRALTLENYQETENKLKNYPCTIDGLAIYAMPSALIDTSVAEIILKDTRDKYVPQLLTSYNQEMMLSRQRYLDLLPSKKAELEKAAQASTEEAARIRAEMERKEEEEKQRKRAELEKQEEEQRKQAEMKAKAAEMGSLFAAAQAGVAAYQPKTSVKKKLVPLNSEAFMQIISLWWSKEGCTLSVDELSKIFKKQLTFCEKLANDKTSPEFINSEHLYYEDEVKAK